MKKIHFEQIICTCSQKSQTTGSAGFGVRSKSAGISNEEAYELYTRTGINYSLPSELKATEEIVKENPNLEKLYPSIYTFKSIQLECNGEIRYIIGRTLYIAMEYGYFGQMDSSRRAGSNYIAHLLVFKELPDISVLSRIIKDNLFYPHNTLCSSENEEMYSLLIGEPTPLDEGYISFDDTENIDHIDNELGWMIIGLLQAYKNQKTLSNDTAKSIIFKVHSNKVNSLLYSLGSLPKEITNCLFLQANTMTYSNVSEGLKMLIVNEKCPTPTEDEYYITIDLLDGVYKTHNIEDNYLYKQILKCCQEDEVETLFKIVDLFLRMTDSNSDDYEFSYSLMLLSATPKELTINELNVDTLDKIASTALNTNDERAVWEKVNNAINRVFSVPCQARDIRSALEDVNYLNNKCPHHLSVSPQSCDFVIDLLFNKSEMFIGILGNSKERLDGAIYMIENAQKFIPNEYPNECSFYNSLNTSSLQIHWEKFIKLYYGQYLNDNIRVIVNHILDSNVQDKENLAKTLFPIDECVDDWKDLINGNIEVAKTFKSLITEFFIQHIGRKPNDTMHYFLSINKEPRDLFDNDKIANTYLNYIESHPSQIDESLLSQVRDSLLIQPVTKERCSLLLAILREQHLTHVDTKIIALAQTISKNKEYLLNIFDVWVNFNPQANEVAHFADNVCGNPKDAARIIETIWNTLPKKKRTDYVLHVTDNMSWHKYSLKRVSEYLSEKELKQVLVEENSFVRKMVRKGTSAIVNLLTNKK